MGLWTKVPEKRRSSNATNASVSSLSSSSLHNHSRHNIHDPATTSSMELSPPSQPQQEPLDWGSLQAALRAGTVTADDEEHISKELVLTVQKLCQVSNEADQIRDDAEEEDANDEMVVFEREEPLLRDPYSEKDPHHTSLCPTVPRI